MLKLENIEKKVGSETYLYPTSLELNPGSFNVLLGQTNSGKTTLMRLIAGLETPDSGRVFSNGKDVTGLPVSKRKVAMVYQNFINYPGFTVFDNIASPMRAAGKASGEIKRRVEELAELLNLSDHIGKLPSELSGGQQQRTAIGRALANDAELLLLDEPLVNLDYKLREEMRDELPGLIKDTQKIIVYSTSDPAEALLLKGVAISLHEGRVVQCGETLKHYKYPKSLLAASIFSYPPLNTLKVRKVGGDILRNDASFQTGAGIAALPDGEYTLGFRAHQLLLLPPAAGSHSMRIDAKVLFCEISGSESFVNIECEGMKWVAQTHELVDYGIGKDIAVHLDFARVFLFGEDGRLVYPIDK